MTSYHLYEDGERAPHRAARSPQQTQHADLVYYTSSVTPGLQLAAVIHRPVEPKPLLVTTHGWHMSANWRPDAYPNPADHFVTLQVDMRGRALSDGEPDCNGLELWDVIDAIEFTLTHYRHLIADPDRIYLSAGSGGGGNVLALINKFPLRFAAACALYGISDYAAWYRGDDVGEFRDEMDVWIGASPDARPDAYRSRSGLSLCGNQLTPLLVIHGERDQRCPVTQSRAYVERAQALGKPITYRELGGIGGRSHLEGYTESQQKALDDEVRAFLLAPRPAPALLERGVIAVGGYVSTPAFTLFLERVDDFATVRYDLTRTPVAIETDYPGRIQVRDHRIA